MATVIRFSRHGSKKKPFFRMVVQDHRAPRDGKFIEYIGSFRPTHGDSTLVIDRSRLEYWLSAGAQMSDSVRNRLKVKIAEWKSGATPTTEAVAAPKAAPKAKPAAAAKKKAKEA